MCGTGYKLCCICGNAGGCLSSMREDFFFLASRKEVEKRLKEGKYSANKEIMEFYLSIPVETLEFCKSVFDD